MAAAGDQDGHVWHLGSVLAELAADLKTITARHKEVAKHDIGLLLESQRDSLLAVFRFKRLPARVREELREHSPGYRVIVDQENCFHGAPSESLSSFPLIHNPETG